MPVDLTKPLSWKNASHDEQRMLRALQGNILKSHGRSATVNIFFKIDAAKKHQMRAALREIANYHATSAYQQLIETDKYHATGKSGNPFVSVFLSATGYTALGVAPGATPADPSFKTGMKAAALGDALVRHGTLRSRAKLMEWFSWPAKTTLISGASVTPSRPC